MGAGRRGLFCGLPSSASLASQRHTADRAESVPRDANEADYDDTLPILTEDGTAPLDDARADAALRAQLNGIEQVPPVEQMYDYSLVREAYQELRASGWKPTP